MKKIYLTRKQDFFNRLYAYQVVSNTGQHLGRLPFGETITIELPEAITSLQIKMLWCGSRPVVLAEVPQGATLLCSGQQWMHRVLPGLGVSLPMLAIVLNITFHQRWFSVGVMSLFLLVLVATLTLYRNRWIKIAIQPPL